MPGEAELPAREAMDFDVVIVVARARRARRGDPPQAGRRPPQASSWSRRARRSAGIFLSGVVIDPIGLDRCCRTGGRIPSGR